MIRVLQSGFIGLFFIGFIGFGSVLVIFAGVSIVEEFGVWNELRPARSWPVQQVEILDARRIEDNTRWYPVPTRTECRFRVHVAGRLCDVTQRKFSGHYSFMSPSQDAFARQLNSDGPNIYPGDAKNVLRPAHVNPADPTQACLAMAIDDAALGFSMMIAAFIGGLGSSMILIVVLIVTRVLLSPEGKKGRDAASNEADGRLTLAPFMRYFWLWCALLMTPGTIAAAYWLMPALMRKAATADYWIPVGLQVGPTLLFWWFYFRNRRWKILAGDSYVQLDLRPINRVNPPAGRLYLAPTHDFPDSLSLTFRLDRRISSKQANTDYKRRHDVHRIDDLSAAGPWYPVQEELSEGAIKPTAFGSSIWSIIVTGRTEGRRFKLVFLTPAG